MDHNNPEEHENRQRLVLSLNSLVRTARIHDDKNKMAIECANDFAKVVVPEPEAPKICIRFIAFTDHSSALELYCRKINSC